MFPTVQRAVTRINSALFFGEDVAFDEAFTTHGLNFISQVALVPEAVRLVPSFLRPLVTKLIKGRNADQKFVFSIMTQMIEQRLAYNTSTPESSRRNPQTFTEGYIDHHPSDHTTANILNSINTTWVTSSLAIPILTCHLLQDLYTHAAHLPALT
ncbi:hypothetical protein BU26DRAFT_567154 [Trematosphaeria pertusa]|uniref:Cytochrome P450 n=1 Tax=Trematosphaeria pertusa TaxID=390896 RepID=A0A6A6IBE7_9PLEO|nr:uncharacterized protein BU26DRAFT_567154 [Trematosphaeria pertusa]KAF2246813.1 hypothetical protein BU26DRAFT_567154 [Trematosphaeria pertusa]